MSIFSIVNFTAFHYKKMSNLKLYQLFLFFLLITSIFFIFLPALDAKYATIDDRTMLASYSGSLKDLSWKYIVNTFKHRHAGLYHPLVTLSYSLEKTLFGYVPAIFHFNNILLHAINTVLVFLIFFYLSKSFWLTFIITALFAIHPTRAEVVCWISSRKDLLYSLFYLLSVWFYIKSYEKKKLVLWITLSIFFYLVACLSKPMAITLPFALVIIDYYKGFLNKEKIKIYSSYFIITLFFIVVAFVAHYANLQSARFHFDIFRQTVNFINAHFNILFYLDKLVFPIKLYCMYPFFYNEFGSLPPKYILYSPAVLYLLIYFCYLSLTKTKIIFCGYMFFFICMLPASSVFPIGDFVVADRYTYIPYLGLFFIFAKFIIYLYHCLEKCKITKLKFSIIILCLTIFGTLNYLTFNRTLDWKKNSVSAPVWMTYYDFGIENFFEKRKARKKNKKLLKEILKNITNNAK